MSVIRKNEATAGKRTIYLEFLDLDGNPLTGQTFATASGELFTSSGGGAWTAAANNGTAVGNGVYAYTFSQAETNVAANEIAVRFVKSGYRDQFGIATILDPADANNVNVTQWSSQAVPTPAQTGVPTVNTHYWNGTIPANLDAAGNVPADVQEWLGTAPHALLAGGYVQVDVEAWNGTAVAVPTTAGIPKVEVATMDAAAVTSIWQYVIENSVTAEQMVRGFASALLAKANGFDGATRNFRDLADTKNRIVTTVDATGRTAVTLTLT